MQSGQIPAASLSLSGYWATAASMSLPRQARRREPLHTMRTQQGTSSSIVPVSYPHPFMLGDLVNRHFERGSSALHDNVDLLILELGSSLELGKQRDLMLDDLIRITQVCFDKKIVIPSLFAIVDARAEEPEYGIFTEVPVRKHSEYLSLLWCHSHGSRGKVQGSRGKG